MTQRYRLSIALASFFIILALAIWLSFLYGQGAADMTYVFCEARAVLNALDPYADCAFPYHGYIAPSYPLTAALYGIIYVPFAPYSGQIMFAVSCALLAFAATRHGHYWRLLLFLSMPFLHDLALLQWAPFILAIYFLPDLLPLALVKPQLSVAVILSRLNRYRFAAVCAFGLLTLLLDPTWPFRWLVQAQTYDGYIPLLRWPLGPLMLLALLNWRNPRALFLLLLAISPQRGFYDLLMLFAVPNSLREMMAFVALSFLLPFWSYLNVDYRDWVVLSFYLPALALTLYPTITAKLRGTAAGAAGGISEKAPRRPATNPSGSL